LDDTDQLASLSEHWEMHCAQHLPVPSSCDGLSLPMRSGVERNGLRCTNLQDEVHEHGEMHSA
jgi:hypothetical protein